MTDSPEYLTSEGESVFSPCVERSWRFAVWFAVIAFVVGGAVVFWMGYCTRMPAQPPGTAACGHEVVGTVVRRYFLMVIAAPGVAIVSALAGGVVGGAVDWVLYRRRQAQAEGRAKGPPS